MVCLYCRSKTVVVNSRLQRKVNNTWRRRACINCGALFTSLEQFLLNQAIKVQDDKGQLSDFSRDKLLISIYNSCKHRPKALSESSDLTDTVITKLLTKVSRASLDNKTISVTVADVLKRFDKAACTHYLAYHR